MEICRREAIYSVIFRAVMSECDPDEVSSHMFGHEVAVHIRLGLWA